MVREFGLVGSGISVFLVKGREEIDVDVIVIYRLERKLGELFFGD